MSERCGAGTSIAHGALLFLQGGVELTVQIGATKPAVGRQIDSSFISWLHSGVLIPDVICTLACIPRPVFILRNLPLFYKVELMGRESQCPSGRLPNQLHICSSFVCDIPSILSGVRVNISKFVRESLQ